MADYARMSFSEVDELYIDDYLFLMREAFIFENMKTESGREYLDKCWRLSQTEPDREKLREKFGKKEVDTYG